MAKTKTLFCACGIFEKIEFNHADDLPRIARLKGWKGRIFSSRGLTCPNCHELKTGGR